MKLPQNDRWPNTGLLEILARKKLSNSLSNISIMWILLCAINIARRKLDSGYSEFCWINYRPYYNWLTSWHTFTIVLLHWIITSYTTQEYSRPHPSRRKRLRWLHLIVTELLITLIHLIRRCQKSGTFSTFQTKTIKFNLENRWCNGIFHDQQVNPPSQFEKPQIKIKHL